MNDIEATSALSQALADFRAQHPPRTFIHNDATWSYLLAGRGEQPLLWLVGGLRVADAAFRSIPLMTDDWRIIAPDYPPLPTLAELADGLAALLDAQGIARADVLAGSFGGMLAQVFVRRHPSHVRRLILSTTSAPNPSQVERYQQQLAGISQVDDASLRTLAPQQMLATIAPPAHETDFWRTYLAELYGQRLDRAHILTTYQCLIDFMSTTHFTPDDLRDWPGRILLIASADDATFSPDDYTRLRELYPQADTFVFEQGGHSPASTRKDEYFALVRGFLTAS